MHHHPGFRPLAGAALLSLAQPVPAQPADAPQSGDAAIVDGTQADDGDDIVVTATRGFSSVISDIPADEVLDETAIASYGASNVGDLVAALSAQTSSGRGRGSGPPVVLVNGRRVSGFGEIRNLPPEAIERTEIFPPEVALDYGFAADQRVINFVLKRQFSAVTAEIEAGALTDGGRGTGELESGVFRIDGNNRINISAEYERAGALTEAERSIIQASGIARDGTLRTLLGASESIDIEGTIVRPISDTVGGSLNLRYEHSRNRSLQGPQVLDADMALEARTVSDVLHAGASSDGRFGDGWRWTLTGNYDRVLTRVSSERDDGAGNALRVDRTRSLSNTGDADLVLSGGLFQLPAGRVRTSLQAGWRGIALDTVSERDGTVSEAELRRTAFTGSANLDLPIASRSDEVLAFAGDLSVNARYAYRDVSDFGGLVGTTLGINWSPIERVDLVASWVGEENAPTVTQLGAPQLVTPGRTIFDFTRGETVIADLVSGGNPNLLAETRRDFRAQISWRPIQDTDLVLSANYARTRSRDTTAELPLLTPEIEAAFPGRVVRDAGGRIVSVDVRPVNFEATFGRQLRSGISYSKSFGQPAQGPGAGGRVPGAGRPDGGARAGGGARRGGGRGPGGPGLFGGGASGGRWNVALYHTVRFQDEILIRSGLPVLDLLNGSATGGSGGSARHEVEFDAGWFNRGIGVRANGTWRSGSTVVGGPIAGGGTASDLTFSNRMSVNLRFFVDLGQREALVRRTPFFRNARVRLAVDNLFNDRQTVRDTNGIVPLRYQQGFLDPAGRFIELSFQKRF